MVKDLIALEKALGAMNGQNLTNVGAALAVIRKNLALIIPVAGGIIAMIGVAAYNKYQEYIQSLVDGAKQSANAWEEQSSSLEEYKSRIQSLRDSLASGTLSEDEAYQAKADLLSIQNELNGIYGDYAGQLDLVNGKIEEQIGLLDSLNVQQANNFLNEGKKGIDVAEREIEKQRTFTLATTLNDESAAKNALREIIDRYDNIFLEPSATNPNTVEIKFTGNASEAEETLNSFMTDVRALQSEFEGEPFLDSLLGGTSEAYDKARKITDEYSELYRQAKQAELITDQRDISAYGITYQGKTLGELYRDYAQAVSEYNEALASGDSSKIEEAGNALMSFRRDIGALGSAGMLDGFTDLFNEVTESVDTASESVYKFKKQTTGSEADRLINSMGAGELAEQVQLLAAGSDDANPALQQLISTAKSLGLISDNSAESVEKVFNILRLTTDEAETASASLSSVFSFAKEKITDINTAVQESMSATGLSAESIEKLKSAYSNLASYDPATLFENTATGVRLNQQALEQLNREYDTTVRNKYDAKIQELSERYLTLAANIDTTTMSATEYNDAINQLTGLQNEIQEAQMLVAQYDALTSSYNAFISAQSSTDSRTPYENVYSGYEKVQELLQGGWVGDSEVTSYLDLMLGDNWRNDFDDAYDAFDHLKAKIGDSGHSLMDFFTLDSKTGKLDTQGLQNFLDTVHDIDDSLVQIDEDGNYSFNWSGRVEEVAAALGTSTEMVELLEIALRDAGFEIEIDPLNTELNALSTNVSASIEQLEQMRPTAMDCVEVLREMGMLSDISFDFASTDVDSLNEQLESAQSLLSEMIDENGEVKVEFQEEGYPELQAIILTLMNQLHVVEQPAIMKVDTSKATSDVSNLVGLLQEFWNLQNDRELMLSLDANADTSSIDSQIDSVLAKIGEVPEDVLTSVVVDTTQLNNLTSAISSITDTEVPVTAEVREESIDTIKGAISSIDPEAVELEVNNDSALSAIQTVDRYQIGDKKFNVGVSGVVTTLASLGSIKSVLSNINSKTITITTKRVTHNVTTTGGTVQARGSTFANGSTVNAVGGRAYVGGDWRVGFEGVSLGSEEGPEILVRDGRWQLIGKDSAEFFYHKPNDIIFNAEQTRQLLENGKILSGARRGTSYANGTVGGFAFSGKGNFNRNNNTTTTTTTTSNNRNNSNSNSNSNSNNNNNNNNNNRNNNNNNSSLKKGLDAFKEWFEKLFDWIEVLVNRRTAKIESLIKKAEIQTGNKNYGGAAGSYRSAINETAALSEYQRKAYSRYNEQASTTLSQAVARGVISKDAAKTIKQRVASGTININEYSEEIREVIKDYQQWYDKAQEASQAIQDLHANIQKYIKDLKDLRDAQRDATVDRKNTIGSIVSSYFSYTAGTANSQLNYSTSILKSVSSAYSTNIANVEADTKSIGKSATSSINARLKEKDAKKNAKYKKALQNAKSAISKKKAVTSADMATIRKYSLVTYERLYAYNLVLQSVEDTRLEYETTFAANQATIFENISNKYNNLDNSADNTIELLRKRAANATSASGKNSQLDKIIEQYNNKLTRDDDEIAEYTGLVNSSKAQIKKNYKGSTYNTLSSQGKANVNAVVQQVRNAVNGGTTIPAATIAKVAEYFAKGYLNQSFYESCIQYNNALQHKFAAENQKKIDEATIKAEKAAIGTERVENVQKQYDNQLRSNVTNSRNTTTSARELKKARGIDLSAQDYQTQIASYISEAQIYTNARNAVQQTIQQNLDNGLWTTSSQEYLDAIAALSEYNVKIDEANVSIEGLRDALRDDVYWRTFERAHDAAQRLASVLSGINDLIDDDSLFDSDGGLTDFGVARIAMLTKELASARTEVQNYANDIQNLNDLYAQGQYTELEYNEKLGELQTNLLKSASSAKSFTDSIVKMYKEMAKSELDAIFKLIEARKSALKAKKDYYDYDKKLKTKSNDIQALEAQLAALQDIDTAEARARTAKLAAELQEKQDDLTELVQDHEFGLSSDALSGLKDTLQETFDDKWEHISGDLNAITELLSASNSLAAQSAAGVQSTLNQLLTFYGVNPVKTGISRNYASGTKKVPFNMTALTNENGPEIIVTPNGIITPLPAGSGVVPADLTERLYAMAQNYAPDKRVGKSSFAMPQSGNSETIVNQHYDSMIHIDGSADAATVEDLKKYSQKILDESYKYVSGKVFSGYVRSGGTRRV